MIGVVTLFTVLMVGCGSDSKPPAPLSAFQPEIVNNPDNFSFQATGTENVTYSQDYSWSNSGTMASIDHSSAVDSGTTLITLFDANGTQVYQSSMLASGTPSSSAGVAGDWTIRVNLTNCYGTLNFRVQMQ
jgi:hypothetical protein